MKKYGSTFLLAFIFLLPASGQRDIDSLKNVIARTRPDTQLVMVYRQLYRAYYAADQPLQMLEIADKGLALSRQLAFERGLDFFLFYKATALDMLGRGSESIPYFEEGIELNLKTGDTVFAASNHINIGVAYHNMGELDKALASYLAAHDIYERFGEKEKRSKVLNNIGIIFRNQQKFQQAMEIYEKSLALKREMNDSAGMAASLQNLGVVYGLMGEPLQAISYLEQAVDLYGKAGNPNDVAGCLTSLGQFYLNKGEVVRAKSAYQTAWDFYRNNPDARYSPITLEGLGKIALKERRIDDAERYLRMGLAMSREFDQKELQLSFLQQLSRVLEAKGEPAKALAVMQEAFTFRDSLTEERKLLAMEEMQARFDVKQKENDLKISQLELKQRTAERNRFRLGVVLLTLLALAIFFALYYRIRLHARSVAHQSELHQQKILRMEQEHRLTALTAMLDGQERERTRIANDLHDSLGGFLVSIKSHLNASRQDESVLTKTNALLDEAATEVRRISHNMMPRALALSGLQGAIEDLAQDLKRQGLTCDLELIGLENLTMEPGRAVMVYRIVQELTHNVIKHARATHLFLQAIHKDGQLTFLVEDDGQGFDVPGSLKKKGLGLSSVASRVQFLQGEIDWDSVQGEGTTVSVRVPV